MYRDYFFNAYIYIREYIYIIKYGLYYGFVYKNKRL